MYAKTVQLINCGPIDRLDISFPFNGDAPRPVLLVGANGSGKSIFLSHIVNGLLIGQRVAYPETPEVEERRVYKFRSSSYIKIGEPYYFAKVDFEENLSIGELVLQKRKQDHSDVAPPGISDTNAHSLWEKLDPKEDQNYFVFPSSRVRDIRDVFSRNCVLYFPPNRFEEPAWLNQENLNAKAHYMDLKHIQGYTNRKVINYSPLSDIQNWLFEVIFDRSAFEMQTQNLFLPIQNSQRQALHKVLRGYEGNATTILEFALRLIEKITRIQGARFGIGPRQARTVSLMKGSEQIVPNVFQLSSGETSLLNLFLSILRDYDLSQAEIERLEDIRGIVIVDEIDLHLHADHQYQVLPDLIQMFPKVQFIVTTHSPLFVLGMERTFGEDGFAIYRLPLGRQISPEEFGEFGNAYKYFAETGQFSEDIRKAIDDSQKPIVFVEGKTDIDYIQKAAELLDLQGFCATFQLLDGGGYGGLNKIYKNYDSKLSEVTPQKIILCYDCDKPNTGKRGMVYKRNIPKQEDHLVESGIENLLSHTTLQKARNHNSAFIDVTPEHSKTERGECLTVPEEWTINRNEKANLCSWLCENGTVEDFKHFHVVFDLLEEVLGLGSPEKTGQAPGSNNSLPST